MRKESLNEILDLQENQGLSKKTVDKFIHMQEVIERIDFDESYEDGRTRRIKLLSSFMHDNYYAVEEYAAFYYEEARSCYINGEFIACILMCQLVCSEMLKSHQRHVVNSDLINKAGFNEIVKQALTDKRISKDIADTLHKVNRIRNSLEHTKDYSKDYSHNNDACPLGFFMRYESEEVATEYIKLTINLFESLCWCSSPAESVSKTGNIESQTIQ